MSKNNWDIIDVNSKLFTQASTVWCQYASKILKFGYNTPLYDCKPQQNACMIPLPVWNILLTNWTIPLYDSKPCIYFSSIFEICGQLLKLTLFEVSRWFVGGITPCHLLTCTNSFFVLNSIVYHLHSALVFIILCFYGYFWIIYEILRELTIE